MHFLHKHTANIEHKEGFTIRGQTVDLAIHVNRLT